MATPPTKIPGPPDPYKPFVSPRQPDVTWLYGMPWFTNTPRLTIEALCYRTRHPKELGGLGAGGHIKRFIQGLWPEKYPDGKEGYIWHDWSDERFDLLCEPTSTSSKFEIIESWWGPSAVSKSTDAAIFFLADWLTDPENTTTLICSTDLKVLRRRIFGEVMRFHAMLGNKGYGEFSEKRNAIMLDPKKFPKAGLFAIPVRQGSEEETRNAIVGQHNKNMRLCIDEAQETREAVFVAAKNIRTGATTYIQLAMGNPDGWLNPLGMHSEPVSGRNSIHQDRDHIWKTKEGICAFWDGRKSPGMRDPVRFHFMLKKEDHEETIRVDGENSLVYWRERIGFVMPPGMSRSIIPETMILDSNAMQPARWASQPVSGAGCDPAFTKKGNRCIFYPFKFGRLTTGQQAVAFGEFVHIKIDSEKIRKLRGGMTEFLEREIIMECTSRNIPIDHLGLDSTGMQNMLADNIERATGGRVHRCESGTSASSDPTSDRDLRPASDVYQDKATELWYQGYRFFASDSVRGITHAAALELSTREPVMSGKGRQNTKIQVESKEEWYDRRKIADSPDVADALLIALDVVRRVLGFWPNVGVAPEGEFVGVPTAGEWNGQAHQPSSAQSDIDSDPENYLTFEL